MIIRHAITISFCINILNCTINEILSTWECNRIAGIENKGGGKKGIIIAFVSLLLATNLVSLYFNWDQNETIKVKEEQITAQIDSISKLKVEMDQQIADLTAARDQIAALNGNVDSLNATIANLESLRDAALSDAKKWKSKCNNFDIKSYPSENFLHQLCKTKNIQNLIKLQTLGFKHTTILYPLNNSSK